MEKGQFLDELKQRGYSREDLGRFLVELGSVKAVCEKIEMPQHFSAVVYHLTRMGYTSTRTWRQVKPYEIGERVGTFKAAGHPDPIKATADFYSINPYYVAECMNGE